MKPLHTLRSYLPLLGLIAATLLMSLLPTDAMAQRGRHASPQGRGGGGRSMAAHMEQGRGAAPQMRAGRGMPTRMEQGQRPTINGGAYHASPRGNSAINRGTPPRSGAMARGGRGGNNNRYGNGGYNFHVRRGDIHNYHRAPYRYGGWRYYSYRPYFYHPYRPYYWGPQWHPWGFFTAALATTAIILTVENQPYRYDNGMYYRPSNGGYVVVAAPVGAIIPVLPANAQVVQINGAPTNDYYYGGTYYERSGSGYAVVPPMAGATVQNLPAGGQQVKVGDQTYVKVGDTLYAPVEENGQDMYEVVQVEQGDN